jgi:hypothetical protein
VLANLLPAPGLPSCLGDAFPARRRRRGIGPLIAFALSFAGGETQSLAMDVRTVGDQLILSGPVVGDEVPKVEQALNGAPAIRTIILRNSPGGDVSTGFRLGDLFRARSLRTAVSGYCFSSCSRMFLGGASRFFTDDYPPEFTHVGFHGHYRASGALDAEAVKASGLEAWIIAHSDGMADPDLVRRWISIPRNVGMIHFYHPALFARGGVSTFMCQGVEPMARSVLGCEPIAKTALELGIVTSLEIVKSNDQAAVRAMIGERPKATGFAAIDDIGKAPLDTDRLRQEYQRFLFAGLPRAFAVSPDGMHGAWVSGRFDDLKLSLAKCEERSGGECKLYAVDNDVVWTPDNQGATAK